MTTATRRPTRCLACGSTRLRDVFGPALAFLRCRDCASLMDADPLAPDEVVKLYEGREYYVKEGSAFADDGAGWGYSEDYLAERDLIEVKFNRVLGHLERYVSGGRLLDVGSGPGFLVASAQQRGWDATGLDLNEWAVQYGRDELGVQMVHGELADEPFEPGSFDAITMLDLVEHVTDPDDLLARVGKLVRPGGAIALLTPDAGAWPSRMLGRRWPEVRRHGEHLVLFSVAGLSAALARHGFAASGWHSIGKTAPVDTILSDVESIAPGVVKRLRSSISPRLEQRVIEVDPRTKFCLYARKLPDGVRTPTHRPARLPRRPEQLAAVEEAILEELGNLSDATRYRDWLYDNFGPFVPGADILEVGAGIGTFTQLMLNNGARHVLAVEPEESCADVLDRRFDGESRVEIVREFLPDAPTVRAASKSFDLAVCQNVLEHIDDDGAALRAMRDALRPGGRLLLNVPAGPRLFGALDDAYGHWRRYTTSDLGDVVSAAGFEIERLAPMNVAGIVGWWAKARRPGARVGSGSLRAFESLVPGMRRFEERRAPRVGLSIVCVARNPLTA